jgi:arsenate reductase
MAVIEPRKITPLKVSKEVKDIVKKRRVLFLCTHNAGRSQMAEGLLRQTYPERYEAYSAGAYPTKVNPLAVKVMSEIGIDLSSHYAKNIEDFKGQSFDLVVTVCTNTSKVLCPFCSTRPLSVEIGETPEIIRRNVNFGKWIEHGYHDPNEAEGDEPEKLAAFRRTRDEMSRWITEYFADQ